MKIKVNMKNGTVIQGEVLRYNYIDGWIYLMIRSNHHYSYRLDDTIRTVIIHG